MDVNNKLGKLLAAQKGKPATTVRAACPGEQVVVELESN